MPSPRIALVAALSVAAALTAAACKRKGDTPAGAASLLPGATAPSADATKLFSDGAGNLMKALTEPTGAVHFAYKGKVQGNPEYPHKEGSKPELTDMTLVADVSADELSYEGSRGAKKSSGKAKKSDEMAWAMTKLAFLGPLTNVGLTLAFAAPVAKPVATKVLGGSEAQRFNFDSRTASMAEKTAMNMALGMLGGKTKLEAIHGTCAVDKATRRLVAFNYEVAFKDPAGNSWTEHHEGTLTAK